MQCIFIRISNAVSNSLSISSDEAGCFSVHSLLDSVTLPCALHFSSSYDYEQMNIRQRVETIQRKTHVYHELVYSSIIHFSFNYL